MNSGQAFAAHLTSLDLRSFEGEGGAGMLAIH